MFDIQEQLKNLPDCPGVYLHKDSLGNIIYVGKAVSLKNRVRQYFQSSRRMDPKVASMVSQIAEFEYIRAGSEVEALILECNLIKKYRPKYNILLRDDKTYPYIEITNEEWPRIIKTRLIKKDGGRYFGPYSDAGAVNRIVDLLNSSLALKRCSAAAFPPGFRSCLNYHINQCRGICEGRVDHDEYAKAIDGAVEFLSGRSRKLISALKEKMQAASDEMNYEEAAIYRDHIEAAKTLLETQRVVLHHSKDADILVPIAGSDSAYMIMFFVRDGKLTGRENYELDALMAIDADQTDGSSLVGAFLKQHYIKMTEIPKEILVSVMPDDVEVIEGFLSSQAGHNVSIIKPARGEKRALVQLAIKDVEEMAGSIEARAKNARDRRENLGKEIHNVLKEVDPEQFSGEYDGREFRAEAYDISNTNGVDTVGAMVAFQGLKADRKGYRKFKVRTVEGPDDYGAMQEVLCRRFTRVFQGDDAFAQLPDVILVDGGKGHVSTAMEVVDASGFNIPVVGMVKDDRHRTRALIYRKKPDGSSGDEYVEISLEDKPLLFAYVGRIQEEVHRFAIEYHRKVRGRRIQRSALDEIPGIGEKRRNELLKKFKSVDKIKMLAKDDEGVKKLASTPSMDKRAAENIRQYFSETAGMNRPRSDHDQK